MVTRTRLKPCAALSAALTSEKVERFARAARKRLREPDRASQKKCYRLLVEAVEVRNEEFPIRGSKQALAVAAD